MQIISNMTETEIKMKKTRRGKRSGRRSRRCEYEMDNLKSDLMVNTSSGDFQQKDLKTVKWRKFYVRPRYSPKAPHNSTQFIMNDQRCSPSDTLLDYSGTDEMSFYSSGYGDLPKQSPFSGSESDMHDSDFEPVDFNPALINSSVYMVNDFESFYNQMRAEELSKLSRDELVEEILTMEEKMSTLEEKLQTNRRKSGGVFNSNKSCRSTTNVSHSDSENLRNTKLESRTVVSSLLKELELLKQENSALKQEHETLPFSVTP